MSLRLLSLLVELGTDHEPTWADHIWQVSLYLRVELHTKHGNFIAVERNRVFHRGMLVRGCCGCAVRVLQAITVDMSIHRRWIVLAVDCTC